MKERHEIIRQLGSGGFGSVFLAHDTQLDRNVAIKKLDVSKFHNYEDLKQQLLSEAKILAGLRHPNIVSIFDVIETSTGGEIIMELIEGETLDQVVANSPLTIEQFLFVSTQLLSALATAHENNIVHCDLKPSNLMLSPLDDGNHQTTVLDFGLSPSKSDESKSQTNSTLLGSIHFMAPELIESGLVSPQSDIYSLGCLFYYALTGKYPFDGESPVIVMASHLRNSFKPLQEHLPDLPQSLCEWLESFIKKDPNHRVGSCRLALNELLQLEGVKPLQTFAEAYKDSDLTNTIQHSLSSLTKTNLQLSSKQQAEFDKSKKRVERISQQPSSPLADRVTQTRPQDLWYFSIDDVRKGPLPFTKICELITEGFIRAHDKIYHHRIGQWTPASEIPEFAEELLSAESLPPRKRVTKKITLRKSQRVKARKEAAIIAAANVEIEPEEIQGFPAEIATTLLLSIFTLGALFYNSQLWQTTLAISATIFILLGFIFSRIQMKQLNRTFFLLSFPLPGIADALFAAISPKKGMQPFILILLGVSLILFCYMHRSPNDLISSIFDPASAR